MYNTKNILLVLIFSLVVPFSYNAMAADGTFDNLTVLEDLDVTNEININSTTNVRQIDIIHTNGQIFSVRSLNSTNGLFNGGIGLSTDSNGFPFYVFDGAGSETLSLNTDGVGIGIYNATAALHVYTSGSVFSEAKILVENDLEGAAVDREMFTLMNNGGIQVSLQNTANAVDWELANEGNGDFSVSRQDGSDTDVLKILVDAPSDALVISSNGVKVGGGIQVASSRSLKSNIHKLSVPEAIQAFESLVPVKYNYKTSPNEQSVGFIAEDVPDLLATQSRKSISTLDVVAVLTRVVQQQQEAIKALEIQVSGLTKASNVEVKTRSLVGKIFPSY